MKLQNIAILSLFAFCAVACSDEETAIKNDMIKKTLSPSIVGEKIEFAYAMGTTNGTIIKAEAVASVAGMDGTGFELNSWFTAQTGMDANGVHYNAGDDVPVRTVKDASTDGNTSTADMMEQVDAHYINPTIPFGTQQTELIAATLRYNYVVPAEAKGKTFHITFTAISSTGERISYRTADYKVSKMNMKRLIELSNGGACYFSIEDMKAYTLEEVNAQGLADKIDFIYNYQDQLNGFDYAHSFVSPATDPKFIAISGIVPQGASNDTPMEQRANVHDAQLKGDNPAVYVDDIDFETLDLNGAMNYVLNLKKDDGAFMKTSDGKWAAFIYVNSVDASGKMTVSIKRYPLQ